MRIIAKRRLRAFWEQHPEAESALKAWHRDVVAARWTSPADVKRSYVTASIIGANRVVFNVRGNRYRIVVALNYAYGIIYVRFVGTRAEYDAVDAVSV